MRRRYEFRRLRAAFLKVFLTMLLLMIALGALYALLQSYGMMESVSYSFLMLPDPVRGFFGFVSALDLSDPLGYFCRMMLLPMAISSIIWLAQGARALNAEQASGLAELLFTQPGSRSGFFWRRWSQGLAAIVVNLLLLAGLTSLFFLLALGQTDFGYHMLIWTVFVRMLVAHVFCWNLGVLCSALFVWPAHAGWVGLAVLLVLTLTSLIPACFGVFNVAWYWSFLHYSIPEYALHMGFAFSWPQIGAMALALLVTLLPGWLMMRTREIDCEV